MVQVDKNREVEVTLTKEAWPEDGYTEPGAVYLDTDQTYKDHLLFGCPGCGKMGSIRAEHPKPATSPSWDITEGSLLEPQKLTLKPSIHCVGCCGWHGFLVRGKFQMKQE